MPPLTKHQQKLVDMVDSGDASVYSTGDDHYYLWRYMGKNKKPKISRVSPNVFGPLYGFGVFTLIEDENIRERKTYDFELKGYKLEEYIKTPREKIF